MHVALVEPEIPPNTGSIARLCAATSTPLHLIGRLGFSIDDKHLKRAGLDYWPYVDVHQHAAALDRPSQRAQSNVIDRQDHEGDQAAEHERHEAHVREVQCCEANRGPANEIAPHDVRHIRREKLERLRQRRLRRDRFVRRGREPYRVRLRRSAFR